MTLLKTLVPLLLTSIAAARQCSNFLIPIEISSRQGKFLEVPVETNLDVGAFATRLMEYQKNYTATLLQGYQTLRGHYHISAQYCHPDSGSNGIIQLLSHGIGFDKTYWDLEYDNYDYSYVNNALDNGYSTLAIDRLGIGNSSHGDPFNEIQAQAEVEALNCITTKLRNGNIKEVSTVYEKVVHVGHSFGAIQSFWLSALYPNNTDGVVLTGYSTASEFMPYIVAGWNLRSARLNQPLRFGNASNAGLLHLAAEHEATQDIVPVLQKALDAAGIDFTSQEVWDIVATTEILDLISGYNKTVQPTPLDYPSGYFTTSDLTALQYAFLYPGTYDIEMAMIGEQTKQPLTAGELLTIGTGPKTSAFTGPALVFIGEHDVPFCGGNCHGKSAGSTASNIPAEAREAFPSASVFESYIQPSTGHGLAFAYNATAGYQVIQDFLAKNGLAAE